MFAWLAANWITIVCIVAVLGIIALCLRNILPRKGKPAACAGCAGGCSGSCSGCSGCASKR